MTFTFSKRSRRQLEGVHPGLVAVVERALEISPVDFTVISGVRTAQEQMELYKRGASQLSGAEGRVSKHQVQDDGWGHAVDMVPYVAGGISWEWRFIYIVAGAMQKSSQELDFPIRWGGSWSDLTRTTQLPDELVTSYVNRKLRAGKRAFTDGAHYEVIRPLEVPS